jgi:hypothetical protein
MNNATRMLNAGMLRIFQDCQIARLPDCQIAGPAGPAGLLDCQDCQIAGWAGLPDCWIA